MRLGGGGGGGGGWGGGGGSRSSLHDPNIHTDNKSKVVSVYVNPGRQNKAPIMCVHIPLRHKRVLWMVIDS